MLFLKLKTLKIYIFADFVELYDACNRMFRQITFYFYCVPRFKRLYCLYWIINCSARAAAFTINLRLSEDLIKVTRQDNDPYSKTKQKKKTLKSPSMAPQN